MRSGTAGIPRLRSAGQPLLCLLLAVWLLPAVLCGSDADDLLAAQAAMTDGLYTVAERQLVRFLEQNRGRPADCVPALIWLCQALAAQGRPVELLNVLDANPAIVEAGRAEGGLEFWYARALLDLGRGQDVLARVQGLQLDGMSEAYAVGVRRLVARAQLAAGDRTGAQATFAEVDRATTNVLTQAENLLEWAQAELAAGHVAQCEALLRRQAASTTNLSLPALVLGNLLQAQLMRLAGREAEAEAQLNRIAGDATAPLDSRAEVWVELAAIAAGKGLTNDVRAAGPQILDRGVSPHQAWRLGLRYGRILVALSGLVDEGAALLKRCIREQPSAPESAAAQKILADAWLAAGSNTQAAAEYRNYLETYGEADQVASALRGRAVALFRLGSYAESAATFQKAAQAASDPAAQAESLLKAADAYHADRHYEQSATLYARVAEMTNAPALTAPAAFMAADALERLGRAADAERAFTRLADLAPAALADEALLRLALLYERREAVAEALRAYGLVIDRATNALQRGAALLGRGRTHYRNYRFEPAILDLSRVLEANPARADEAAYLEVLSLYGAGRDEEAAALCETFTARHAQSPLLADVALWMAQYSYNRRDYDAAEKRFVDYAGQWPSHVWADAALVWAARAAMHRSEFSEAIALLARLPRDYPGSTRLAEARFLQADALCELARFEEAILVFDEIINRYPESESVTLAWLRKGDSLFALGSSSTNRYDEALKAYEVMLTRPDATHDLALQAAFKRGRCFEKLGRSDDALDQYYGEVVLRYLRERSAGIQFGGQAQAWFARAAMQAASIREAQGKPESAVNILKRLIQSGVPGAAEAQSLVEQIQGRQPIRWPAEEADKEP